MKDFIVTAIGLVLCFVAVIRGPEAMAGLRTDAAHPSESVSRQVSCAPDRARPNAERNTANCLDRASVIVKPAQEANAVDLRLSAGRGRVPANDVGRQQQNAAYLAAMTGRQHHGP